MTQLKHPTLPTPEPLRGSELGTFTHDSVVQRLPDIVRRTITENDFSRPVVRNLKAIIAEIPNAQIHPLEDSGAPDKEEWASYVKPYSNMNWLEAPWFFVEFYLYRRILEATGYFQASGTGHLQDPYILQKRKGLEATKATMKHLCARNNRWIDQGNRSHETITSMLLLDLWGNRADLSLWPIEGRGQEHPAQEGDAQERMVINHSIKLVEYVYGLEPSNARIDLLLDNAGFELVADLLLTDYLISMNFAHTVVLHPKNYPIFVSDALIKDVEETIAFMETQPTSECGGVGKRLRGYLQGGRLIFHPDTFWTSPLALWDLPPELRAYLEGSDLVISKGDANYRRLLGDRHWEFTTSFGEIMSHFHAPIVALRACKSEVMCGLASGQAEALLEKDSEWMTNGQWGVIQYKA